MDYTELTDLLKYCLWNEGSAKASWETFREMKNHTLFMLPGAVLGTLSLSPELHKAWELAIFQQISYNLNCENAQNSLPVKVPYVILKGTSAAKYYPNPKYRVLGDIDLMVSREDFPAACENLLDNGFSEIGIKDGIRQTRHREFRKNDIEVEVHQSFAHKNDPAQAETLDELILQNINPSHELPDLINGIVLIEHVNHHMESGLGLRQIIDWMMYVDKCLPDEKWPQFQVLAEKTGNEMLCKVTTRMCELYLGLPERKWAGQADEAVCRKMMDYIVSSGNFGNKQADESKVSERFLSSARTFSGTLRFLQERGMVTWTAAKRHPVLRPFAWVYQLGRYLKKGLKREGNLKNLKQEYTESRKRNELFDALQISREEKGIVIYMDGKYQKQR